MYVLRFHARGMHLRHFGFEREHPGGAGGWVREARQLEHCRDVRLVLFAQIGHVGVGGDIVVAVGHAEAALEQIGEIVRRVGQALCDPDSEEVAGLEVGVVQRIHIRAQLPAQATGESMAIRDGRDRVELGLQRSDALGLDGGFVHEGRVIVADLPGIAGCGSCAGRLLKKRAQAFPRLVGQYGTGAITRLVGGNGGCLDPAAVGVGVEIVTRRHGLVHSRQVDARRGR